MQKTSPLYLKAMLAEQEARQQLVIQPAPAVPVVCPVPLDAQGRPHVKIVDQIEPTLVLVKQAVERYHGALNRWPAVILLSTERYVLFGRAMEYYYHVAAGVKIPYACEGIIDYDVLCR